MRTKVFRSIPLAATLLVVGLVAGCGGGGGGNTSSASSSSNVTVSAPIISTQPSSANVLVGQTLRFSVFATGSPTPTYQWLKNGTAIDGANSSSYATAAALSNNGEKYSVRVTNSAGSVTSNEATATVQRNLVVSEVSSCYFVDVDCWFEIFNPSSQNVSLADYSVKSTSIKANTGGSIAVTNFSLPNVVVAAGGYVVVSGNTRSAPQRGSQIVRLVAGGQVPYWSANGFVELLSGGSTVDFVRFGTSSQSPVTATAWTGLGVSALPYGATDYGKSIVRPFPKILDTNTHTASDWTLVNWSTPGGRNDVPATAVDSDGDGIPNTAKVPGGTFAGIDLYAMGARLGRKALFIEVDSMQSNDPGVKPRKESLQKVVDSFKAHGIDVFFDAGNLFNTGFSVTDFNLGQGSSVVAYEKCVTLDQVTCTTNTSDLRSIYDWKDTNMDLRRRSIFHYLLMGNSQKPDGSSGSSGIAELPGNDFLVTMGNWGFTTGTSTGLNMLINMQAGTIMHELGHNLGLLHGGFENANYKPNYWSIMNYAYQLNGLDPDPASSTAFQRWLYSANSNAINFCNLVGSPCGAPANFVMSYSDGTSANLNELAILEQDNIGRGNKNGTTYADWDQSGGLTIYALSVDLNGDGVIGVLKDYNDWANLVFPFARQYGGNSGTARTNAQVANLNPVSSDRQESVVEEAPPASVIHLIRQLSQQ